MFMDWLGRKSVSSLRSSMTLLCRNECVSQMTLFDLDSTLFYAREFHLNICNKDFCESAVLGEFIGPTYSRVVIRCYLRVSKNLQWTSTLNSMFQMILLSPFTRLPTL